MLRVAVPGKLDDCEDEWGVTTLYVVVVEVVSEQGTTVMMVATRVVEYVLRELNGQSVTDAGHFVIVSTMVESTVDVVDERGAVVLLLIGDTTMLVQLDVAKLVLFESNMLEVEAILLSVGIGVVLNRDVTGRIEVTVESVE